MLQGRTLATFLRERGIVDEVNQLLAAAEQKPTCCALPFLRCLHFLQCPFIDPDTCAGIWKHNEFWDLQG